MSARRSRASSKDRGSFDLLAEATKLTLDDAGITLDDVDGMVTAFSFVEHTLMHATTFCDYLGFHPGYFASVAVGGATAPLMAVQAALAIDAGLAEVVLCVRGDNTRSGISSSGMIAQAREMTQGEFEWPYGVTTIGGYGLLAQRYMHEYNVPQEALAAVVATQSEHGALKWNAMLRDAGHHRGRAGLADDRDAVPRAGLLTGQRRRRGLPGHDRRPRQEHEDQARLHHRYR